MQLLSSVRQLGFPKCIGRDEMIARRMSFNRETLDTVHAVRDRGALVLAAAPGSQRTRPEEGRSL